MAQDHNIPVQPEDLPLEGVADATMTFANAEPEPDLVVPKASEVQPEDLPVEGDATAMMPGIDLHHQDADVDDLEASDGTTPNTTRTSPGPERSQQRRNLWIPFFIVICVASLLIIIIGLAVGLTRNAPSSSSPQSVENYIVTNQFSSAESLRIADSPQSKAAKFMTQYALPSSPNTSDAALQWLDTYVMSVFYYSTNGPNWVQEIGFQDPNTNVCDWHIYLITGSGELIPFGASCGYPGRVNSIAISGMGGLVGTLPSELGLLTDLELIWMPDVKLGGKIPTELANLSKLYLLDFEGSPLGGSIPNEFRSMTSLIFFDLVNCGLSGTIPNWIGEWTSLTLLALTGNQLKGSIPASLTRLTDLKALAIDDNLLTGHVRALRSLTKLKYLYLARNGFEELIDETFLSNNTQLIVLDMSNNAFVGKVPVHLMNTNNLFALDVNNNQLEDFPDEIVESNKLQFLAVNKNPIAGTIPSSMKYLTDLEHLDLTSTDFSGEMPSLFGNLTNLQYLFLAYTSFDKGTIPDKYQSLQHLQDLSLQSSNRIGTIPSWIEDMDRLLLLDLGDNELTGELPWGLTDMLNLRFLLLNRNQLNGTIPEEFGTSITDVEVLLLDHNNITGSLDPFCFNVTNLTMASADCKAMTKGEVPEVICDCCNFCCNDDDPIPCNDVDRLAELDPDWQHGYSRDGLNDYNFRIDYNETRFLND